jgi:pre-60S factor REI1
MSSTHGFQVPNLSSIQTDLETFISYLSMVVNSYHECLHCGHVKQSAEAVRAHMIAKGHCMLDLSENSEYLDFWKEGEGEEGVEDTSDDYSDKPVESRGAQGSSIENTVLLSDTELRLASGVVATSRHGESSTATRAKKSRAARTQSAALDASLENPGPDHANQNDATSKPNRHTTRALALRSSMGLVGLSSSEVHALAVQQRKIDLSAFRARKKAQWTLEKMGNKVKQKHFKVGSMCRSGLFIDPTMF